MTLRNRCNKKFHNSVILNRNQVSIFSIRDRLLVLGFANSE